MDAAIPEFLRHNLQRFGFGADGTRWLAGLPDRIAALEAEWDLCLDPPFDTHGAVSWVAPATLRDGTETVLKITFPHDEPRYEADALRTLESSGAVRLLRVSADGFSLLLERCRPGTDLWALDVEEGNAVAAGMLARIWRVPAADAPSIPLSEMVAGWWDRLPRMIAGEDYDPASVRAAIARGTALAAAQPRQVLLHGDFHPGNVLAAQREPWLWIDPKPLIGDPAYDLAQLLYNRARSLIQEPDAVAILRRQIAGLAADLDVDPARAAGWAFVKSLGHAFGPAYLALFEAVARGW